MDFNDLEHEFGTTAEDLQNKYGGIEGMRQRFEELKPLAENGSLEDKAKTELEQLRNHLQSQNQSQQQGKQ